MSAVLSQFERKIARILELVEGLEEISVPDVAKKLKKSPTWVRKNLPVIYHGPKSHHVRLVDIETYRSRRTVFPNRRSAGAENGRTSHDDNGR
jgi:hypothetical protein